MQDMTPTTGVPIRVIRGGAELLLFALAAWLTAESAVFVKQSRVGPALVAVDRAPHAADPLSTIAATYESAPERPAAPASLVMGWRPAPRTAAAQAETIPVTRPAPVVNDEPMVDEDEALAKAEASEPEFKTFTPSPGFTKYFDGRPIRPARTVWMTVTAYSPDERSCGDSADGRTATNHSVWTNAMRLVAADPKLLPYGTLLSVPGYAEGEVVPVLDCGGAIKGKRLDVLYPTHEIARKWGVRRIPVVVWEYADGKGTTIKKK